HPRRQDNLRSARGKIMRSTPATSLNGARRPDPTPLTAPTGTAGGDPGGTVLRVGWAIPATGRVAPTGHFRRLCRAALAAANRSVVRCFLSPAGARTARSRLLRATFRVRARTAAQATSTFPPGPRRSPAAPGPRCRLSPPSLPGTGRVHGPRREYRHRLAVRRRLSPAQLALIDAPRRRLDGLLVVASQSHHNCPRHWSHVGRAVQCHRPPLPPGRFRC